MTDTYYDKRPVQRRTLALVAVLALCMVSLTSVAYAYSTTVSIEDNPIADHYYTIDYTNDQGTPCMVPLTMTPANDEIVITTVVGHTVSGNAYTERTVTASIDANTFTRVFYVKFNADGDVDDEKKFTIDVTAKVGEQDDAVLSKFITQTSFTCEKVVDGNATAVDKDKIVKDSLVKVTLTMNVAHVEDVNTLELSAQVPATISADDDETNLVARLNAVKTELATHTFDVVVSVQPTITP